ncbi:zinc ribbon domain-containing protein [Streptococcus merionis]
MWETVQLEIARRKEFRVRHKLKSYMMQNKDNPFATKVFCAECSSAFGRKNWMTSRRKRKIWQCNNRYKIKGQIGCHNHHIDEETLELAVVKATETLSDHVDLLHGKWEEILSEGRLLDKHYGIILGELLKREVWEFDAGEMCQVLDHISVSENGQLIVVFLEGTEIEL